MDFLWKEHHRDLQATIRAFVADNILPHVDEWETRGAFPVELIATMGRAGFLGLGSDGKDVISACIVSEETGKAGAGINATLLVQSVIALHPIFAFGNEAQRRDYHAPAVRGEKIAAIAMTEPEAGSDVASISTTARREGGMFIIDGSKMFITNGTIADFVLVAARTSESADKHKGLSLILVDRGTPGFETVRKLDKLGWRAGDTAELRFTNCRVPATNLVGEEGRGFYDLMNNLDLERTVVAADCVGLAQAAYEASARRARERRQFGKAIAEFQDIRTLLVDMHVQIDAARLLVYRAATMIEEGKRATVEASTAKYFASETARTVTRDAMQVFGGFGFLMESPVQRYYRDAPVLTVGGGTSQIQRQIIATQLGL